MGNGRGASRPRFRLLPTVLLTLAILVLPSIVYAWGRTSSSFTIEKVVVDGAQHVKEKRLKRLIRRDYMARNLFTVTSDDVEKTLARVPYVADVAVNRDFPHTLRVTVREHQPVAHVYAANSWFTVSAEGHVIAAAGKAAEGTAAAGVGQSGLEGQGAGASSAGVARAATATVAGVGGLFEGGADSTADEAAGLEDEDTMHTLREGPQGASLRLPRLVSDDVLKPGRLIRDEDTLLAVGVIARLPKALREGLDIAIVKEGSVTFLYKDGLEAVWGDRERAAAKAVAFRAVMKRYRASDVRCTYIDVSVPDRVLGRPVLE